MQGLKNIREAKAKAAREKAKRYSINAVAAALDVSKPTLISWEKGETAPRIDQAMALAEYFGCSVDDIFLPNRVN